MKKAKGFILLLCLCLLTGCSKKIETTDFEDNEISEYIAGVVLKHDSSYKESLIYTDEKDIISEEQVTEQPVVSEEPEQQQSQKSDNSSSSQSQVSNQSESNVPFGQILGNKHVKVEVTSYKTYDSYKDSSSSGYLSLEAPKGKKLLITQLKITNSTDTKQKIKTLKKDLTFQLKTDGELYSSSLTLLENDLQFLNTSLEASKSKTAVLVFEVPVKTSLKDMVIIGNRGDLSASIEVSK